MVRIRAKTSQIRSMVVMVRAGTQRPSLPCGSTSMRQNCSSQPRERRASMKAGAMVGGAILVVVDWSRALILNESKN